MIKKAFQKESRNSESDVNVSENPSDFRFAKKTVELHQHQIRTPTHPWPLVSWIHQYIRMRRVGSLLGLSQCFCYWLADRKGTWPVKAYATYPKGSLPEQVMEENQWEPADSGSSEKWHLKWKRTYFHKARRIPNNNTHFYLAILSLQAISLLNNWDVNKKQHCH